MKKRKIIIIYCLLVFALVSLFLTGCIKTAQEEKVIRVGVLWTGWDPLGPILDGFKEKMAEFGYIEGKNITYEVFKAPEAVGNEEVVQKYVDEKVDLIFSFATEATVEAHKVAKGSGIPVVFTCAFIEGTGIVESVSNPGGNITGVRYPTTEAATGRLDYLHQVAPNAERILVPYLKDYPTTAPQMEAIKPMAMGMGVTIIDAPFATAEEFVEYIDERDSREDPGIDAILTLADPFAVLPDVFNKIYSFGDERNIPVVSFAILNEAYGPIISFAPTIKKMGTMAAMQANKVLKGTPAGNLPVFTSDNDLGINYKYAQKLGLTVPEGVLLKAYEILR